MGSKRKGDRDRHNFLDRLGDLLVETKTSCYAWALIPNHLLMRTGLFPISKVMQRLLIGNAVYFNRRNRQSGNVFQNRYKSEARSLLCYWATNDLGVNQIRLAQMLNLTQPAVSMAVDWGRKLACLKQYSSSK